MKKNLLALLTLIILFSNCKKNDSSSIHLKLVAPTNSSNPNPSGITFTWESDIVDSTTLVVGTEATFKEIVYSAITLEHQNIANINFQPGKTYYWKVTQNGITTDASTFTVNNVLNQITKEKFVANFHAYNWVMNGPITNEENFSDTISLVKHGDSLEFIYAKESINQMMIFNSYIPVSNTLFYKTENFGSNGCLLNYNYIQNEISVTNKVGGLGSGKIWEINF